MVTMSFYSVPRIVADCTAVANVQATSAKSSINSLHKSLRVQMLRRGLAMYTMRSTSLWRKSYSTVLRLEISTIAVVRMKTARRRPLQIQAE